MLYLIFSMQGYIYNELPISLYFSDIATQVLPMVFFFIGQTHNINREKFYRISIYAITLAMLIGIYGYVFSPSYYVNYITKLTSSDYSNQVEYINYVVRFNGLWGSTASGTLANILCILSFHELWFSESGHFKKFLFLFTSIFGFTCAMITQQRSAMVMAPVCLILMILYYTRTKKMSSYVIAFLFVIAFIGVYYYFINTYGEVVYAITERFESVSSAFSDRNNQWELTFENSKNLILGTGMGSAGTYALEYTKYAIPDGALLKIIAECGIIGFCIFTIALSLAARILQ